MADATAPQLLIQSVGKSSPSDPPQIQITSSAPGIFAFEAVRSAVQEASGARADQAKSILVVGIAVPPDPVVAAPAPAPATPAVAPVATAA